jgi:hypothetical protein
LSLVPSKKVDLENVGTCWFAWQDKHSMEISFYSFWVLTKGTNSQDELFIGSELTVFLLLYNFEIVCHHLTFCIFLTSLQNLLKSRRNYCWCQPKSGVMCDWWTIQNCTVYDEGVYLFDQFGIHTKVTVTKWFAAYTW